MEEIQHYGYPRERLWKEKRCHNRINQKVCRAEGEEMKHIPAQKLEERHHTNKLIKNQFGTFPRFEITKEKLYQLYIEKQMSQRKIARMHNVGSHTVASKLLKFAIGVRKQNGSIEYYPPLGKFFQSINRRKGKKKKNWQIKIEGYKEELRDRTTAEMAWLAGIIDGEGYIGSWKGKVHLKHKNPSWCPYHYIPELCIYNTNKKIINEAIRIIGVGKGVKVYKRPATTKWKVGYRISVWSYKLEALLQVISPFLIAKREQAEIILRWFESRRHAGRLRGQNHVGGRAHYSEAEVFLIEQLKVLNRKGPNSALSSLNNNATTKECA